MSTVDLTPTKIVSEYDQEIPQSQICFSKIYPDAHVSTKINTFTVCKGVSGGGGAIVPRSQRNVKNGGFSFVTSNITYQARG